MSTILLLLIYMAFIGLGVPDSLFGVAWPAIYAEYGFPFSFGSVVTAIIYAGTMVSSLFSAKLIRKFGTYWITAFSTALTAFALLGFSFSGHFLYLCLCAIPLGLGAGCIDTALNNYVALHYSSRHLNFLHCFYGIGITLSPYVFSVVLAGEGGWRGGCQIAFAVQLLLALIVFFSFPVWRKTFQKDPEEREEQIHVMGFREVLTTPLVRPIWLILLGLSAVESICNTFGATYLVEEKGLVPELAATIVMFYYVGLACGRFLAGLAASRLHSWKLIFISQSVLGVALLVLLFASHRYVAAAGFFFIGLGNGPLFPNMAYLIPELFGPRLTPSIMGTLMAVGSLSMMLFPLVCGFLGQALGMWVFTAIMLLFYVFMLLAAVRIGRAMRRKAGSRVST